MSKTKPPVSSGAVKSGQYMAGHISYREFIAWVKDYIASGANLAEDPVAAFVAKIAVDRDAWLVERSLEAVQAGAAARVLHDQTEGMDP